MNKPELLMETLEDKDQIGFDEADKVYKIAKMNDLEKKKVDAAMLVLQKEYEIIEAIKNNKKHVKNLRIGLAALKKKSRRAVCNLADYKYKQTAKGRACKRKSNKVQNDKRKLKNHR